jgi:hydrogenase maturation protease
MMPRVLVAGMGNELLGDDGFGMVVARRFAAEAPDHVRVVESGIAGIGLVQDLMDGFDAVVICDAADRDAAPGTVWLLKVDVPSIDELDETARRELLADMHATVPARALVLAGAIEALPARTYILGCQPQDTSLGIGLSTAVADGVEEALDRLRGLLTRLGAEAAVRPAAMVEE